MSNTSSMTLSKKTKIHLLFGLGIGAVILGLLMIMGDQESTFLISTSVQQEEQSPPSKENLSASPSLKSGKNTTELPLTIADGFELSILAKNIPGARVLVFDTVGNLWVSQSGQGKITRFHFDETGNVTEQKTVLSGLRNPHGLAFDPDNPDRLFIAEEQQISVFDITTNEKPIHLIDLPTGGRHTTRTLGFGPDRRLYVSIGSSCDTCVEKDARRAAIYSLNKDGSDFKPYATGLRNVVFFTWNPQDKTMWTTEMGRDFLGNDTPSDEINEIKEGGFYGWPWCYGKNIHDVAFDASSPAKEKCQTAITPRIELGAHVAPLGLAFIPSDWPTAYQNNLIVAEHGSWNRSPAVGYKLVRVSLDGKGETEDFITGWLQKNGTVLLTFANQTSC